jgi:hypothetical protein
MTIYSFSGFHTYNSFLNEKGYSLNGKTYSLEDEAVLTGEERDQIFNDIQSGNAMNLLGALPLGGILAGYRRFKDIICISKISLSTKIYNCVRAIFEILGCGFLFVITIDLPVSLHRHFWTKGTVYPLRESNKTYFDVVKSLIKKSLDIDETE